MDNHRKILIIIRPWENPIMEIKSLEIRFKIQCASWLEYKNTLYESKDKETQNGVSSDFIVVETLDYTVSSETNCSSYSVGVDSREGFRPTFLPQSSIADSPLVLTGESPLTLSWAWWVWRSGNDFRDVLSEGQPVCSIFARTSRREYRVTVINSNANKRNKREQPQVGESRIGDDARRRREEKKGRKGGWRRRGLKVSPEPKSMPGEWGRINLRLKFRSPRKPRLPLLHGGPRIGRCCHRNEAIRIKNMICNILWRVILMCHTAGKPMDTLFNIFILSKHRANWTGEFSAFSHIYIPD